jgi:RND family efflux transporter MFP subunit
MTVRTIFKSKWLYIGLVAALIIGGIAHSRYKAAHKTPTYETAAVSRGNLEQTVDATGKIQSVSDLSLRFEGAGAIDRITVREGQTVATGTVLMSLKLADLNAAVAAAQANLNQKLAGATDQDRAYYQAAVDSAKSALEQAQADAASTNLNGITNQALGSSYQAMTAVMQSSLVKLDDSLTQADNILGLDNPFVNQNFRYLLGSLDNSTMNAAISLYTQAKISNGLAHAAVNAIVAANTRASVDSAIPVLDSALVNTSQLLSAVSAVLKATPSSNDVLPLPTLDQKKTTIETTRTALTAQYTSFVTQKQNIAEAKSNVQIKQAAYDQAVANLNSHTMAPREVDVAYYRAQLAQALASRDKAILRAPQSGIVTDIPKKRGELVTSADTAIKLLSPHYEVTVDIPETDVAKLRVNQTSTLTLDAFGEDTKLTGIVTSIDPASTEIQDVVYYKVTIRLNDTNQPIKPGMTANVSIHTGTRENVLYVPLRTVRTNDDGTKYVRVLENKAEKNVTVTLGLKANEGKVEITSGLDENQNVIVSVKE